MSIKIIFCETDEHFEKYARFMIKNRKELNYDTENMIKALCNQFHDGEIMIGLNENNEVVSTGTYFFGTMEKDYENKHILFLDNTIILEEYRSSFLFVKGLKIIVDRALETNHQITEVRLKVLEENKYLNRLYSKFADPIDKQLCNVSSLYTVTYSTGFSEFQVFINKYRKRLEKYS